MVLCQQCPGARVPVKQWLVCVCLAWAALWDHIDVLSRGALPNACGGTCQQLLVLAAWWAILPLVLHPSSQRSSRVSGDSLRAESWQHLPLTGGQMLPGHEQTNRHQPDRARAQMAERSLACWGPSHKLAMLNRGPLLAAFGQDKVIPVCSPQEL